MPSFTAKISSAISRGVKLVALASGDRAIKSVTPFIDVSQSTPPRHREFASAGQERCRFEVGTWAKTMNERSFIVKWPLFYEAIRTSTCSSGAVPTLSKGRVLGCSANCQIEIKQLSATSAYTAISITFLVLSSD